MKQDNSIGHHPQPTPIHPIHKQRKNDQHSTVPFARRQRILLVDDDRAVRDSIRDVLIEEGFLVLPAENGQEAVEMANRTQIDLVLLDLNLPVKNGWDTFALLSNQHRELPIIIATARANQIFTALSAGASALLEKPFEITVLLATMEKLLAETGEQRLRRITGKIAPFYHHPSSTNGPVVSSTGCE